MHRLTRAAGVPDVVAAALIFTALRRHLGLRLEHTGVERDVLVAGHIERPAAN